MDDSESPANRGWLRSGLELGGAEFVHRAPLDLAAQLVADELVAVAQAQDGQAGIQQGLGDGGRVRIVNGRRPSRKG